MAKRTDSSKRGVTMQDVARHASVSRATVSRIVNKSGTLIPIAPATRQRVLEAIEELGYTPNRIAQSLMTSNTRVIGLSMGAFATPPDDVDEWHDLYAVTVGKVVSGVQSVTVQRSYDVQLLGRCEDESSPVGPHTNSPLDFVEGVIYATPNPRYDLYTPMIESGIPLVMLGPNPGPHPVTSVSSDNMGAICAVTSALIRRGHTRIALILPREQSELLSKLREEGYRRAHLDHRLPLDDKLIVPNEEVRRKDMPYPLFASAVTRALLGLRPRPTAIVIGWTAMALGVLQEIGRQGLRCPEDVELVSYGDEHGFDTAGPGITSLDIRLASMGATAAETLFEEMEGRAEPGRNVLRPPRLRVRGSCALEGYFEPLAAWEIPTHSAETAAI